MKTRLARGFAAVALGLAGCASPASHYYRLAAIPGARLSPAPMTIIVRTLSMPGYLDQTGIAKPSGDYQFDSYANDLWAEPLGDMLQAIMVQDLAQRLPAATVLADGGGIAARAGLLIEMNLLRFDPAPTGQIILLAQIAIKTGPNRDLCTTQTLQNSANPGPGPAAAAAAMSAIWGTTASQIAAMLTVCAAGR